MEYEIKPIKYNDLPSKCRGYIRELASMPNYINFQGNQTSCTCIHYLRDKEDELIDMIVQALLNYVEILSTQQKSYQMDLVQYAQALSDSKWCRRNGVQNNYILPVEISKLVVDGPAVNIIRKVFQHRIYICA